MKKTISTLLLTIFFALVATPLVQASDCDISLGFEDGIVPSFINDASVISYNNPTTTGINTSTKALQITSSGGFPTFRGIYFSVTIPNGKTFADIYTSIKFQVRAGASGDVNGKNTLIGFSNNGTSWSSAYDGGASNINSTWAERAVSVSSLSAEIRAKTGTFHLGIGLKNENTNTGKDYLLDNVVLVANPDNCTPLPKVYTATLNPGAGTCVKESVTEDEADAGVILPIATLSSLNCIATGYTFAGWSTSIATGAQPTELIPAGEYSIEKNITLYAVYSDGTDFSSNPRCAIGTSQGGNCNITFDFEDGIAPNFVKETSVASVSNPTKTGINTSEKALLITSSGGSISDDRGIYFPITVPGGKKFGDVYTTVKFQVRDGNGVYGKQTFVGVSYDGITWSSYSGVPSDNLTSSWVERTVTVSSLPTAIKEKTATFFLGVGVRNNDLNKNYYLDNVVVVANPDNCVVAGGPYTVTLDSGAGTSAESVTETAAGSGVDLPPASPSATCYTFAGWSIAPVEVETATAPLLIQPGEYSITDDITLYAVYLKGNVYTSNPVCPTIVINTEDSGLTEATDGNSDFNLNFGTSNVASTKSLTISGYTSELNAEITEQSHTGAFMVQENPLKATSSSVQTLDIIFTPKEENATHTATLTISSVGAGSAVIGLTGQGGTITSISQTFAKQLQGYSANNNIYLNNLPEPAVIYVYNLAGLLVAAQKTKTNKATLPMAQKGVFIVKVVSEANTVTLRILNK